jgi:ABC-type multidrug transport system fused ATPase/permease subunit
MNQIGKVRQVLNLTRGHRGSITLSIGLTSVSLILGLAQPLVVRQVIGVAQTGTVIGTAIGGLAGLFAAQAIIQGLTRYTLGRTGEGVVLSMRANLINQLLRLPVSTYQQHRIGDLISRASTDTSALRTTVTSGFADAVTGSLGLVGCIAMMTWLDTRLSLVVLTVVVLSTMIVLPVLPQLRKASEQNQRALGTMTADLERALSAIRTVRASRAEARETTRIVDQARLACAAGVRMARLDAVVAPTSELAVQAAFLATVIVGGVQIASGTGSIADLIAFLLYLNYLTVPITALLQSVSTLQQAAGATERIAEVLALPTETSPTTHAAITHHYPTPHPVTALEFRNVWFGYDPQRPILRGASFHLPHRGPTALLGPSGVGKTTIIDLIERFHDPDQGRIFIQGTDIRHVPLESHRSRIGLVEQDCPILYGTLRDNLTYAAPHTGEEQIHRVLEATDLSEFVRRLPQGLDTLVGEHGRTLSGGQCQRIAIARALLTRPALILLDEPTAHVDTASETALIRTVHRVSQHCALLIIAHRPSTIKEINRRLVLTDGTITTHDNTHYDPRPPTAEANISDYCANVKQERLSIVDPS